MKCKECHYDRNGQANSVIRNQYSNYRTHAKTKGLAFNLTLEQFSDFAISDCFYCGNAPSINRKGPGAVKRRRAHPVNGIDRMNNSLGYFLGNCVSCCTACNMMKKAKSIHSFIEHCVRIAEHQKGKT